MDGQTDRGKTVYPPSGSGGIIRSTHLLPIFYLFFGSLVQKIGSKCVDLILIRLAKCWNNFFSSKCQVGIFFFSLLSSHIFFFKIQNQNYFLGKNHIKLKLNSLRGKLIKKKFARPKWFSHKPTKKGNKTVVIRKSHEKIFPSKIRLFYFSKLNLCKLFHL